MPKGYISSAFVNFIRFFSLPKRAMKRLKLIERARDRQKRQRNGEIEREREIRGDRPTNR